MFAKQIVTLNIEADGIRVLAVKGRKVEKWGSMLLEPGVVKDGFVLKQEVLSRAIDSLFRDLKFSRKKVLVSVTGLRATFRILTLPRVKPTLLAESIRWEAKEQMPVSLDELYLSWQVISARANEQDIFVLGMPREVVDSQLSALASAGIKGRVLDFKSLALARIAGHSNALVLNLEPDSYGITLFMDGIPVVNRTVTPKSEGVVLEDIVRRLSEELGRIVDYYNREHLSTPINPEIPVLLVGSIVSDSATFEAIAKGIGYRVEPLNASIQYPDDFPLATYAVNLGLACRGKMPKSSGKKAVVQSGDIALSVLPMVIRKPIPLKYAFMFFVAMALLGGAYPAYNIASKANASTEEIQSEYDDLSLRLKEINREVQIQQSVQNTITSLETEADRLQEEIQFVTSTGSDFGDIVRIVNDALPEGADLIYLKLDATQIVLNGKVEDTSLVIDYAKVLEAYEEFDEVFISNLGKSFTIIIERQIGELIW